MNRSNPNDHNPEPARPEREAREIVNRHLEYMDGLARGQVTMRVSGAIAAVSETLAFRDADRAVEGDWVSVPKVPTEAMVEAGTQAALDEHGDNETVTRAAYAAMINATPATPLLDDETVERCAMVAELMYVRDAFRFEFGNDVATAIRALKGSAK